MEKSHFIVLYCIICFQNIFGQGFSNKAVIWQGFSHEWTYNHRINRLGDFVKKINDSIYTINHTSATGIGKDSTYFDSYYLFAKSNEKIFQSIDTTVIAVFKKNNTYKAKLVLPRNNNESLIINGFDITAMQQAYKFGKCFIKINEKRNFEIDIELRLTCNTIECNKKNNVVQYKLDLFFLKIKQNSKWQTCTDSVMHSAYYEKKILRKPSKVYFNNIEWLAIKGFHIEFDNENWVQKWNMNIQKNTVQLAFAPFEINMKKNAAFPSRAALTKYISGNSTIKVQLLQINESPIEILPKTTSGKMFWKGINKSPINNPASTYTEKIKL
jgi:hypothetical protein